MKLLCGILLSMSAIFTVAFLNGGSSGHGEGTCNLTAILVGETIPQAIHRYKADTGQYPPNLNALVGQYLKSAQITDAWGTPVDYELNGDTFTLTSLGAPPSGLQQIRGEAIQYVGR